MRRAIAIGASTVALAVVGAITGAALGRGDKAPQQTTTVGVTGTVVTYTGGALKYSFDTATSQIPDLTIPPAAPRNSGGGGGGGTTPGPGGTTTHRTSF